MMGAASEKQVAWTCVGYIVAGVFDKGLHLGRVQERQSKIQWIIRHHKTLGAFLWWDIFDDIWCIQAGQENRVGELNCNAGSHDRQFPFISTVDSFQKIVFALPQDLQIRKLSCLVEACCSLSAYYSCGLNKSDKSEWVRNLMECDRFYDFILHMSSYFLQCCFSRWTERNPYYEILRAHQQIR